jgi:chromosome segregation ATPase
MFRIHKRSPQSGTAERNSEILLLRKMLEYLDKGTMALVALDAEQSEDSQPSPGPVTSVKGDSDEAKRFVSEQRSAAEALLRELVNIERRLEIQSSIRAANEAYVAAREEAEVMAESVERARERAETATTELEALAAEREKADEVAAAARADAASAADAVSELERLLEQARQMVSQTEATILEREARIRECATAEREAAVAETQARDALAKHETELAAVQETAHELEAVAEALKREIISNDAAPRLERVAELARRIADSTAIDGGSR